MSYFDNYLRHRDFYNQVETNLIEARDQAVQQKEALSEERDRAGVDLTMGLTPLIGAGEKVYDLAQKYKSLGKLQNLLTSDETMDKIKGLAKEKLGIDVDSLKSKLNPDGALDRLGIDTDEIKRQLNPTTGESLRPFEDEPARPAEPAEPAISQDDVISNSLSRTGQTPGTDESLLPEGAGTRVVSSNTMIGDEENRTGDFGINTTNEDDDFESGNFGTPSLRRVRPTEFIKNTPVEEGEGEEGDGLFNTLKGLLPDTVGDVVGGALEGIAAGAGLAEGIMSIKDAFKQSKMVSSEQKDLDDSEQAVANNPVLNFGKMAISSRDTSLGDGQYFSHF